jgi:hypothetical protein
MLCAATAWAAGTSPAPCTKEQGENKRACYDAFFEQLTRTSGIGPAMATLTMLGDLDLDVARDGHVYSHTIGILGYERAGDVTAAFLSCTDAFQSGCYHGVIQAYLSGHLALGTEMTTALVESVCDAYQRDDAKRWLLFQCIHGLGHGVTTYYGHDLPVALKACDLLTRDWDRSSCYGGAFMENVIHFTMEQHPGFHHSRSRGGHGAIATHASEAPPPASVFKGIDPRDPLYPCSILEERYLEDCYMMQTSVMLHFNHGDMAAAAKTCDTVPRGYIQTCYQSLGRDVSAYAVQNAARAVELCAVGTMLYQPWCYVGAVKNFIDVAANTDSAFALCAAARPYPNKARCYEALGEELVTLQPSPAQREETCRLSDPHYVAACRYGARVPE